MPGKQELESALIAAARLFVDDRAQSVSSGELEVPVNEGAIKPEDIVAELGEVIAGKVAGRMSDDEITVFDTSGIAVQDLAASKIAFERAAEAGLGIVTEL
jgi:ornithine cyclodeaminase/alanine dehydrogenase